ncbi:hypothetical protein [Ochrobactrum sp. AN78]|uniref:hypothetical protein n=1 Tax=Ochrobactrum sp. AN78 TaxID=3039853 RepID=UPI002989CD52|nr:hypothetical protein [Ochrobactrum sp. AN78]MDH7790702.1 hypothetical protein [Ochrobactrum sp. AN78]
MNIEQHIPARTVNLFLDRDVYQVIWLDHAGEISIDGGGKFTDLTRESALDAYREGNVLKVFCVNFIEGTCRDVTDEFAGEVEYEHEQQILVGETFIPRLSLHANSAGRTL